jgi:hypothetical protein
LAEETIAHLTGEKKTLSDTVMLADTGYFAEQNLKLCAEKRIDAYIPDLEIANGIPHIMVNNFPHLDRE